MLILSIYFFFLFILKVKNFLNSDDETLSSNSIGNKIINYVNENNIPLILTEQIVGNDAGSMSTTFYGYLKTNDGNIESVVVKYSSFKSLWNYVHLDTINDLYSNGCYSNVNENTNEYLVLHEDKNRIVNEGWIPCEVYVAFKSYFCSHLMPTSSIVNPILSYFAFFKSIEQIDDERNFFVIYKRIENGISLQKYVEQYSNSLTFEITKYLIHSILIGILKLKSMSIIHLDLNDGNIFLMNNDKEHQVRFIDFAIMKFIHKSSETNVFYSENLHKSLRSIFMNCPPCYYQQFQTPIFAQQYQQQFQTYSIEQIINHPWFYTN